MSLFSSGSNDISLKFFHEINKKLLYLRRGTKNMHATLFIAFGCLDGQNVIRRFRGHYYYYPLIRKALFWYQFHAYQLAYGISHPNYAMFFSFFDFSLQIIKNASIEYFSKIFFSSLISRRIQQ